MVVSLLNHKVKKTQENHQDKIAKKISAQKKKN